MFSFSRSQLVYAFFVRPTLFTFFITGKDTSLSIMKDYRRKFPIFSIFTKELHRLLFSVSCRSQVKV